MRIGEMEVERRMRHFEGVCRDAGVKLTHQRMEVFRELAQSCDHPDAETLFEGVRQRVPTVSLDTVYRTLWLLSDLGLIKTVGIPHERTRFDANLDRHHHFVCKRCGLTRDFRCEAFNALTIPELVKDFGHAETTHVEVQGVCVECAANDHPVRRQSTLKEKEHE